MGEWKETILFFNEAFKRSNACSPEVEGEQNPILFSFLSLHPFQEWGQVNCCFLLQKDRRQLVNPLVLFQHGLMAMHVADSPCLEDLCH